MCEVWRRASDGDTSGRLVDSLPREWMSAFVTVMAAGRTSSLPSCCATRFFRSAVRLCSKGCTRCAVQRTESNTLSSMIARWRLKAHSRRGARGCKGGVRPVVDSGSQAALRELDAKSRGNYAFSLMRYESSQFFPHRFPHLI